MSHVQMQVDEIISEKLTGIQAIHQEDVARLLVY